MTLKLYNTLTRSLCDFMPIKEGQAGVYVCGPTVYDDAHIGHARASVAFDVLARHLAASGYEVRYVRNFTDVDDKIINRARERGVGWKELAEGYIASFNEDMDALNCLRPTFAPRATEYIFQMQEDILGIMDAGHAYRLDGDVYFDVSSLPAYGRLSRREAGDAEPGARVAVDGRKRNPADFALWKSAAEGEPSWPSPWGPGRPGWHIECSAMSARLLGPSFDIHGGGQDLVFPHHENEMAQSAALGRPMANVWLHNGFVNINSEKMSKSLGNAFSVKDILKAVPPEALRFFLVQGHYRGPVDFSDAAVRESGRALERLFRAVEAADAFLGGVGPAAMRAPEASKATRATQVTQATEAAQAPQATQGPDGDRFPAGEADEAVTHLVRFKVAMDDDLNTSRALGSMFEAAHALNRRVSEGDRARAAALRDAVVSMGEGLGLRLSDYAGFFARAAALREGAEGGSARGEIERKVALRDEARAKKDWAEADRLRRELSELGVAVEDRGGKGAWRYV
ncbi:MAG: cysteine--tRNA ligase [Deltaproteobacteria bacterium]|jgi:cysteinyl-tRNA synthetase|nr:cysteine--tRNA ligase [Deltaproteobacteria bacterium]